jgi:hypothetical protein
LNYGDKRVAFLLTDLEYQKYEKIIASNILEDVKLYKWNSKGQDYYLIVPPIVYDYMNPSVKNDMIEMKKPRKS